MLRVTDELCGELIRSSLKGHDSISINFEYNQAKEDIGFVVEFGGQQTDPLADDKNIAVTLLKTASPDIAYRYEGGKNIVEGHLY